MPLFVTTFVILNVFSAAAWQQTSCQRSCTVWAAVTLTWCRRLSGIFQNMCFSVKVRRYSLVNFCRQRSCKKSHHHTFFFSGTKSDLTTHAPKVTHPCLFSLHRTRRHLAPQGVFSGYLRTDWHQFNDRRVYEGPSHGSNDITTKRNSTSNWK